MALSYGILCRKKRSQKQNTSKFRPFRDVHPGMSLRKTVTSTAAPRACFSSSRVAIWLRSRSARSSSEWKERGLIML
jgi:hypothetical protein